MGKRGPAPTPDEILAKTGDRRARKRLRDAAEQRKAGAADALDMTGEPERPTWLTPKARKLWGALIPLLRNLGVLNPGDAVAIGRYCQTLDEWIRLDKEIQGGSWTYTTDANIEMPNPIVAMRGARAKELTAFESYFGLTPSARTSLRIVRAAAKKTAGEGKVLDASRFFGRAK